MCVCWGGLISQQQVHAQKEYPISLLPRALRNHDYTLYSYYHNHCFSKHYQHQKRERRGGGEQGDRVGGEDRQGEGRGGVKGGRRGKIRGVSS